MSLTPCSIEDPGQDSDDVGFRLKFDMHYDLSDQTSLQASLSHDNEPSGDGDTGGPQPRGLSVSITS